MNPTVDISLPKPNIPSSYQKYVPYAVPVGAGVALFILILLIFVPGLSPISALLPPWGDLTSHNDTINQQQAQVDRIKQKINMLNQLDQTKLTANLAKAEDGIPDDKDIASTLAVISQIAAAAGTSVTSSSLLTAQSAEKNSVSYQISLRGTYPAVKDWLVKLENAKRIMTVKSVNLSVADSGQITADMILNSYYEPLPQVSAADAPLAQTSAAQDQLLAQLDSRTNYPSPTPSTTPSGRADPFAGF